MADTVQYMMERMVPELEDLEQRKLFSRAEIKQIVKKRTDFEYLLKRKAGLKEDYLRYIDYEVKLEGLRQLRKRMIMRQLARVGLTWKPSLCDREITRRVMFIYERATRKFKGDVSLWVHYLDFCKSCRATRQTQKVVAKALRLHPTVAGLWLYAASWEFEENANVEAARVLMQRGLRMCPNAENLWVEYLRMELTFLRKLRARREILGIAEESAGEQKVKNVKGEKKKRKREGEEGGIGREDVEEMNQEFLQRAGVENDDEHEEAEEVVEGKGSAGKHGKKKKKGTPAEVFAERMSMAIFRNATSAIPDSLNLRLQFLHALEEEMQRDEKEFGGGQGDGAPHGFHKVTNAVWQSIERDFQDHWQVWEFRAKEPMWTFWKHWERRRGEKCEDRGEGKGETSTEGEGRDEKEEENWEEMLQRAQKVAIKVFEKAVKNLPVEEMFASFASFAFELMQDGGQNWAGKRGLEGQEMEKKEEEAEEMGKDDQSEDDGGGNEGDGEIGGDETKEKCIKQSGHQLHGVTPEDAFQLLLSVLDRAHALGLPARPMAQRLAAIFLQQEQEERAQDLVSRVDGLTKAPEKSLQPWLDRQILEERMKRGELAGDQAELLLLPWLQGLDLKPYVERHKKPSTSLAKKIVDRLAAHVMSVGHWDEIRGPQGQGKDKKTNVTKGQSHAGGGESWFSTVHWAKQSFGIAFARLVYERMLEIPGIGTSFLAQVIDMEQSQAPPKKTETCTIEERVRALFEKSVMTFGSQDGALWLAYCKFELNNGCYDHAAKVHWRAKKTLKDPSQFLESYHFLLNEL